MKLKADFAGACNLVDEMTDEEYVVAMQSFHVARTQHFTDPETGRALARELGGRVVEIEGGGHLLPMRDPGRVAEAIRQTAFCPG